MKNIALMTMTHTCTYKTRLLMSYLMVLVSSNSMMIWSSGCDSRNSSGMEKTDPVSSPPNCSSSSVTFTTCMLCPVATPAMVRDNLSLEAWGFACVSDNLKPKGKMF